MSLSRTHYSTVYRHALHIYAIFDCFFSAGCLFIFISLFRPHSYSADEEQLLTTYPPPTATNFTVSEALLEPGLSKDNYCVRMHDLLNIEEMAQYSSVSK